MSAAFLAVVRRSSIRVTANATNVAGSVTRVFLFPTHFKLGVMLQLFHSGLPNTPVVVHVTSELDTLLCAFASRACGNDSYTSILSLLHSTMPIFKFDTVDVSSHFDYRYPWPYIP